MLQRVSRPCPVAPQPPAFASGLCRSVLCPSSAAPLLDFDGLRTRHEVSDRQGLGERCTFRARGKLSPRSTISCSPFYSPRRHRLVLLDPHDTTVRFIVSISGVLDRLLLWRVADGRHWITTEWTFPPSLWRRSRRLSTWKGAVTAGGGGEKKEEEKEEETS